MSAPADRPESWPILSHRIAAHGAISDFVEDEVRVPDGTTMVRQWVTHPGAVSIMAVDDHDRVAVVYQYRHPVAMRLLEPPAGILDVVGESALGAAKRELAEEAMLGADDWRVLVDFFSSPGGLQESLRVFLARGLHHVGRPDGFLVEAEESDMGLQWIALDELVDLAYAGRVQNPNMVTGTLALALARAQGRIDSWRPGDAPGPAREQFRVRNRELDARG